MPATVNEGFAGSLSYNSQSELEGFTSEGSISNRSRSDLEGFIGTSLEGFVVEVDKPTTDKNRWFIERVMKEKPKRVERDNIITLAPY